MSRSEIPPEQWAEKAKAAYRLGEWDEAAQAFAAARRSYLAAGESVQAAEAANNLSVTYLQAGQAKRALEAVEGTPGVFLAAGENRLAAQAEGNLGSALEACGRHEEAERAFLRSIELFGTTGDGEGRALSLQALSRVQLRQGKAMQALGSMQAGLDGGRLSPGRRLVRRFGRKKYRAPQS